MTYNVLSGTLSLYTTTTHTQWCRELFLYKLFVTSRDIVCALKLFMIKRLAQG